MGYLILIVAIVVIIPVIFLLVGKRPGKTNTEGQKPIGKPVMVEQPAADEANPAASSTASKDTTAAQRKTPPA
ncbi:MAG TPA: hypothetical protein VFT72_20740 [Opitutaceae bacterium]|nr:hypothetical protein [Opitutaceae bacterium]